MTRLSWDAYRLPNPCEVREDTLVVFIESKGKTYEAYFDLEDYPKIKDLNKKLFRQSTGYVSYNTTIDGKNTSVLMHRFIMDFPDCDTIDHEDFNRMNNRKSNLRQFTKSQNCTHTENLNPHNKSGHRNISYDKFGNRWRVAMIRHGKRYTSSHKTMQEAIDWRDELEAKLR